MTVRPMLIRVSSRARPLYTRATRYLEGDPAMARIIAHIEGSSRVFTLRLNDRNDDSFDPGTDTIAWDPHSALRTTSGGAQSPALGLGHEMDHAAEDPLRESRLARRKDPVFDTMEERRVICGSEHEAAGTLGEAVRYDHDGTTFRVSSPIATRARGHVA